MVRLTFFLFVLLSLPEAWSQDYGKPIPPQSVEQWFTKATKPSSLVAHYFWATWCGPCAISLEQLKKMKAEYGKELTVYAYSDETEDLISAYLNKNFDGEKIPFSYGKIVSKGKTPPDQLVHWVSSYPYVFFTYDGLLIWHGNPTYPRKDFEDFLRAWAAGTWTVASGSQKSQVDQKSLDILKALNRDRNRLSEKLIAVESQISEQNRNIFKMNKNYVYFRNFIQADESLLRSQERVMGHQEFEPVKEKFLKQRESDFRNAAEVFATSREELFFVARDLIFSEEELQDLDLAEHIVNRAMELPAKGTTYPSYNLWVKSLLHKAKGEWSLAREYNERAISTCKSQTQCPNFIEFYLETRKVIDQKMKTYCDSFLGCLKAAFQRL